MQEELIIDNDALSRQLATYGHEAQGKIMAMKVFVHGLTGVGIEVAKNLILAGPKQVTLFDTTIVSAQDLGRNFYLNENHIGKMTRAEASLPELKDLNPNCLVETTTTDAIQHIVENYTCVVIHDNYNRQYVTALNEACRQRNIGFIMAGNLGLYGFTFVDFGMAHKIFDATGQEPQSIHIAGIAQEKQATVYLHDEKRHSFSDGDRVCFREVKGMTEINGKQFIIKIKSPFSFTIGDTTSFSPYLSGGIATQIKISQISKFNALEKSFKYPYPPESKEMPICSWQKLGNPEQLHVILNGLFDFWAKHSRLPKILDSDDAKQLFELANSWKNSKIDNEDEQFKVDQLDQQLVTNVAYYAQTQISPCCSFWGGIITQEIVKLSGKYSPLKQWLHHEFFEVLPQAQVPRTLSASRYSDYIVLFGDQFVQIVKNSKTFLIGAGALGCEFIKMFALMGVATGNKGKMVCTDDDSIEISNLNRQFLFRKQHVGQNKSEIACQAGKKINSSAHFESVQLKVAPDTEDYFNDTFWNSLDFVVNAVDNVKARQYVDNQCVWYEKPLFQSGTLGTKCHSQIILPYHTQTYNDIIDPPEETFAMCTLKKFPYQIQHTIQWARDYFEGTIAEPSQQLKKFYESKQEYLNILIKQNQRNPTITRLKLETLMKMLMVNESRSYERCVEMAINNFWQIFHNQIAQLLIAFPENYVNAETGKPFWGGLKRTPKVIPLNLDDPLHLELIQATANIYAVVFNLEMVHDAQCIKKIASKISSPEFVPNNGTITADDKDQKEELVKFSEEDEIKIKKYYEMLINSSLKAPAPCPVQFQKDDSTNFHIEFMGGVSNLRARNYQIEEVDNFKVKLIAGKIIPAIATTTAMVVGAVGIEIIKLLLKKGPQTFKNVTINLALPLWVFNDPLPPIQITDKQFDVLMNGPIKAIPKKFTKWQKIDVEGPMTLQEFKDLFEKKYKIEVTMITYGTVTLYMPFGPEGKKRLPMRIEQAIQSVTKKKLAKWRKRIAINVSGNTSNGIDCLLPDIRYHF